MNQSRRFDEHVLVPLALMVATVALGAALYYWHVTNVTGAAGFGLVLLTQLLAVRVRHRVGYLGAFGLAAAVTLLVS